ncbi:hypothetical protein BLOT_010112 [Blomia tropicalis]|nr:hypothetical protein BLOT_010112 [Blomia tropicalis]
MMIDAQIFEMQGYHPLNFEFEFRFESPNLSYIKPNRGKMNCGNELITNQCLASSSSSSAFEIEFNFLLFAFCSFIFLLLFLLLSILEEGLQQQPVNSVYEQSIHLIKYMR